MSSTTVKPKCIESFVKLAVRAGLIDAGDAEHLLVVLGQPDSDQRMELRELADRFVSAGILTGWQRRNLLRGRWRGFFLGDYKLLEPLGSGGMSIVYLSEHIESGQKVAIKFLPKEKLTHANNLKRFKIEARAAAMLKHPNIVRTYDLQCTQGNHFIVMEHVEGSDLQNYVSAHGPLSIAKAVDVLKQAASGLQEAHLRGLVHRDIKPLNILIRLDGRVKISDFGLARMLFEDSQSLTLQRGDKILGTADYLSPEQAMDAHHVDGRADIYSLGCTLFFMLCGAPPFDSGNLAARVMMHQSTEPPDLNRLRIDIPEMLYRILTTLLAKRPEDRFQSAADLLASICSLEANGPLSPQAPEYVEGRNRILHTPRRGMESIDLLGLNF
jgi:eukaryotic-like serine/threonine-protein kinase